jgi:hypothetical protein
MKAASGIIAVVLVAAAFGLGGLAMVRNFDALFSDIQATLSYVAPPPPDELRGVESGSLDLVIVCGPPTGAAAGMQIAARAMLLGGPPVAILVMVLARLSDARQKNWTGWSSQVFLAGFVFQLGSVFFTSLFLVMFLLAAGPDLMLDWRFAPLAAGLVCDIAGLRVWRILRASASDDVLKLADPVLSAGR